MAYPKQVLQGASLDAGQNLLGAGLNYIGNQLGFGHQKALADKQFDQQVKLWRIMSPKAEVQRYREAGLNPYLMFGSGSAGATGSTSVSPHSSPVTPFQPNFGMTGDLLRQEMDVQAQERQRSASAEKDEQEAAGYKIDNDTKAAKNIAEIDKLKAEVKSHKARAELDDISTSLRQATFSADVSKFNYEAMNARQQNAILVAQGIQIDLQNELARMDIASYGTRLASELALNAAKIAEAYANGEMSYAAAEKATQEAVESSLRQEGIRTSNYTAKKVSQHLVAKAAAEAKKAQNNTGADNLFQLYNNEPSLRLLIGLGASALPFGAAVKGIKGVKALKGFKAIKGFK